MVKLTKANQQINRKAYTMNNVVPALESIKDRCEALPRLIDRIKICGQYVYKATCKNCYSHFYAGNHSSCKSRFCSVCSSVRADAWRIKVVDFIKSWLAKGYYVSFLNLTIKDTASLSDGIRIIKDAFRYMTHDHKGARAVWNDTFCGSIRSIEIKLGKNSNKWHVHQHMIVLHEDHGKFYERIRDLWNISVKAVGGEVSDSLDDKYGSIDLRGIRTGTSLIKSLNEVVKYMLKFDWNALSNDQIFELYTNTRKLHNIQTTGVLYHLKRDVDQLVDNEPASVIRDRACSVCGSLDFDMGLCPPDKELLDLVPDSVSAKNMRILNKLHVDCSDVSFDDDRYLESSDSNIKILNFLENYNL